MAWWRHASPGYSRGLRRTAVEAIYRIAGDYLDSQKKP
jgi:hypothetical protein